MLLLLLLLQLLLLLWDDWFGIVPLGGSGIKMGRVSICSAQFRMALFGATNVERRDPVGAAYPMSPRRRPKLMSSDFPSVDRHSWSTWKWTSQFVDVHGLRSFETSDLPDEGLVIT